MITSNLILLAWILFIGWVVFRFGDVICLGFAVYLFCNGQWLLAGFYFVLMNIIAGIKAGVMLFERRAGYRGPWI